MKKIVIAITALIVCFMLSGVISAKAEYVKYSVPHTYSSQEFYYSESHNAWIKTISRDVTDAKWARYHDGTNGMVGLFSYEQSDKKTVSTPYTSFIDVYEYYSNHGDLEPYKHDKNEGKQFSLSMLTNNAYYYKNHEMDYFYFNTSKVYEIDEYGLDNIPEFYTFDSMIEYFESGVINEEEAYSDCLVTDDSFVLKNVQADNSVNVTWSSADWDKEGVNPNNIKVVIKPQIVVNLEDGEEQQEFVRPRTEAVSYIDYSYHKDYDDFFVDNPYQGRAELILDIYPTYYSESELTLYKGKKVTLRIGADGSLVYDEYPEETYPKQYMPFEFKNFNGTVEIIGEPDFWLGLKDRDFIYDFIWDGTTIDPSIQYSKSYIKVEQYVSEGINEWLEYEPARNISVDDGHAVFSSNALTDYYGYEQLATENGTFRFTPYYFSNNKYLYGKTIQVKMDPILGILDMKQSENDNHSGSVTDYTDIDASGKHENLFDEIIDSDGDINVQSVISTIWDTVTSLVQAVGQLPDLISRVFSFLPDVYSTFFIIGLSVIIALRILGR